MYDTALVTIGHLPRAPRRQVDGAVRWPSRKAMQHARDRIRFMTMRARLAAPVEEAVGDINMFLRGWAGYQAHQRVASDLVEGMGERGRARGFASSTVRPTSSV
jgi:Group II intron, maturase-specific domain